MEQSSSKANILGRNVNLPKRKAFKQYERRVTKPGQFPYKIPPQTELRKGEPTVCYDKALSERAHEDDASVVQPSLPSSSTSQTSSMGAAKENGEDLSLTQGTEEEILPADIHVEEMHTLLDDSEMYHHCLKVENAISIFCGFGKVMVIPDYSHARQKLDVGNHVVLERKVVKFNTNECRWIYWCSCQYNTAREISSLKNALTVPFEEFQQQYPDCIHIKVARPVYNAYDTTLQINPCDEEEYLEGDHGYSVSEDILLDIPNSNKICCKSNESSCFGLVSMKDNKFICHCCPRSNCGHVKMLKRIHSSNHLNNSFSEILEKFEERAVREVDKNRYMSQPKLISRKKIPFHPTPELAERLHKLCDIGNLMLLLPNETHCEHCGNQLMEGDPVAESWIAYENATLITNMDVSYVKVYYRPCTSCDTICIFEGQSQCLLNMGTYLCDGVFHHRDK